MVRLGIQKVSVAVIADRVPVEFLSRNEPVVSFLDYLDLVVLQGQLEESYDLVLHKLGGNRAAAHPGKLVLDKADVLGNLDDTDLVLTPFRLHGDDVVAAALIEAYVELVDLDLTYALHGSSQMVLQTVSR